MDTFVLLVLLVLCGAASGEDPVKVRPGDDVILPCRSADRSIRVVQWTRTDLKSEYVLFYRGRRFISEKQYPSFEGRVQLLDTDLKHGDVSLILKNVKSSDEGTYECRVVGVSRRQKRFILKSKPISRVRLEVTDSHHGAMMDGDKEDGAKKDGGHTGLYIGLAVVAAVLFLVCLVLLGCFLFRKYKKKKPKAPAADEAERVKLNMLQS